MTPAELVKFFAGNFPLDFNTAAKAEAKAALYQQQYGHLRADQLAEAVRLTMNDWEDPLHAPPPAVVLRNVPKGGIRTAANQSINMLAMSQALSQLVVEIEAHWRQASSLWCETVVREFQAANPGHETAAAEEIWARIGSALRMRSHGHAQLVWANRSTVEEFRFSDHDVERLIGKPGPIDPAQIAIREGREPPKFSLARATKGRAA